MEEMTNQSKLTPPVLTCLMFNCGGRLELHDEDLAQRQFEGLQRLLPPSGGATDLGDPPCTVHLSWFPDRESQPAEFVICRRDTPLLLAGVAMDDGQSSRLWDWLRLIRSHSFRCLEPSPPGPPPSRPWLGIILMPGALDLSDDHLDALCGLGQTMGQVWLRRHCLAQCETAATAARWNASGLGSHALGQANPLLAKPSDASASSRSVA